jgi:hypothetical protein
MLYWTYDMLNMFRVLLCPSSGPQDMCYYCLGCWLLGVRCRAAGCASRKRDADSLLPCTWPPTTSNEALHTIGGSNTHIVSSSWWWAYKCPKHVEHIISAINHSVASSWFFFSTRMQRCTDKHTSKPESCYDIHSTIKEFSTQYQQMHNYV